MLADLAATADVRGHRIDVSWTWSGAAARPAFRLLRRRRDWPAGPDDGVRVLDLGTLFRQPDVPWARVGRLRLVAAGSVAEGGLLQAEVAFSFAAAGDAQPGEMRVRVEDPDAGGPAAWHIPELSRVERTEGPAAPWGSVEALALFHTPGGAPEEPAGTLTLMRAHDDGVSPARLRWQPTGEAATEVVLDDGEALLTTARVASATESELEVRWARVRRLGAWGLGVALEDPDDVPAEALAGDADGRLHEAFSEDTGEWTRTLEVSDLGAAPEETAYYRLLVPDAGAPGGWSGPRTWRAHATPTARYGFEARVYGMLPSVHQYYDEPTPEDRGQGQLRRFLEPFGVALDHLRSGAEALRARHDLERVRGDFLPALGAWIDWTADRTQPLEVQRAEIRAAPDVYETVGTLPNVVALAERVTGWPCQAKEFVHNLMLTSAPEHVGVRELWEMAHDGTEFLPAVRLSETFALDARPSAAVEAGGRTWLFFHTSRGGRWEVRYRTLEAGVIGDDEPLEPVGENELTPTHADLEPCALVHPGASGDELWVFWASDREGAWNLWGRTYDGADWGAPLRLTDHPAPDRRPAAATGPLGALWLFFESERRGASEIWARTFDGARWTPPVRVTHGLGRDREPAAALDALGRLHLVWRRDEADRSRLWTQVLDGGVWGEAEPLEDGAWRDEAPTLALRGADLWLLWSSERTGRWEMWGRVLSAGAWDAPFQITQRSVPDKEPFAVVDGAELRVFWRSERPSRAHRSRTVDTGDTALLERRGRFADRIHYTYDTQRGPLDWYARDVVGLYVTPPPGASAAEVKDAFERAGTYLEPFTPATVRVVLIADRQPESVDFMTDGMDGADWITDAFEDDTE